MKLLKLLLFFSLALPAFSNAIQIGDDEGNPEMVSLEDYEGETARPWLSDRETYSHAERLYREFLYRSLGFLSVHMRWPNAGEAEAILVDAKKSVFKKSDFEDGDEEVQTEEELSESETPEETIARHAAEAEALAELETTSNLYDDAKNVNAWSVKDVLAGHDDIMTDVHQLFTNRYLYIRRKIASAYIRAVKQADLPPAYRTVPTSPSPELLFMAMVKAKTNGGPKLFLDVIQSKFNIEHLLDLYVPGRDSVQRTGLFPQPLMFAGGEAELEGAARFDAPHAFRFFKNREYSKTDRAQRALEAIENAKGFVATSWTNGKKDISKDFLDAILKMLEEKDMVLLVGPTQQNYEGLPEVFLSHPRIHVITHTIENSALKISNEQINPDTEDPIPQLLKAGRYHQGQKVIAFSPHQRIVSVATAEGAKYPVTVATTGSISEPFAAYSAQTQGARKQANKTFHEIAALVLEKASGINQYDSDGVQNVWIPPRGIQFYDDKTYFGYDGQSALDFNGSAGFIDLGVAYQFRYDKSGEGRRFERRVVHAEYEYLADPHWPIGDSRFEDALVNDQDFDENTAIDFLGGDTFDNGELSRWIADKSIDMNTRVKKGSILALAAVNNVIGTRNALLERFPNSRYGLIIGNHEDWLMRTLQKTSDFQDVVNGDFLDELNFAVKALNIPVWDWIFIHREKVLTGLLQTMPEKRREILGRVRPIYSPERTLIIDRGEPLYAGPEHRRVMLQKHGDKAGFGRKFPNLKDHAKASPEGGSVTGHTHTTGKYKNSIDVGGGPDPDEVGYAKGHDSAVGQGLAPVYPNGTKQLYIFERRAEAFRQLDPAQVLPPAKFFGEDRLKIVPNDNDLVDKDAGLEYAREEINRLCDLSLTGRR